MMEEYDKVFPGWINRNIVECKFLGDGELAEGSNWINRNIVECK